MFKNDLITLSIILTIVLVIIILSAPSMQNTEDRCVKTEIHKQPYWDGEDLTYKSVYKCIKPGKEVK